MSVVDDGARLIIGVTAHRDLAPALQAGIEAAVRAFLVRMRAEHPELPVVVMSALADGGDRLVARCALDLGMQLIAPLPMALGDYASDFAPSALDEVQSMLARAQVIELPLAPGNDAEAVRRPGPARDRQYVQLGAFISSHCQILLALWDGQPTDAPGGTAEVVGYHLRGEMRGHVDEVAPPNLLADDDSDLVHHVRVQRTQQHRLAPAPVATFWLTNQGGSAGEGPMPDGYRRVFGHLRRFNADLARYRERILLEGSSLLGGGAGIEGTPAARAIDALFVRADWLAIHYRRRVHESIRLLHLLALLMGVCFILYAELDASILFVALFLALFGIGLVAVRIGSKRQWHRCFLDYRVLAEGLRVQFYWQVAGVPAALRTAFAYDSFLQKQDVELGWIRHAMRAASVREAGTGSTDAGRLQWVVDSWIGDSASGQLGYFRRRADERARVYRRTELLGTASLVLSLVAAIMLVAGGDRLPEHWAQWLLVVMGLAALLAAVRESYSFKRADKELIKQYRFMHRLFDSAANRLRRQPAADDQRRILEALGQAALEEHAEWILVHRERPLEHNRPG